MNHTSNHTFKNAYGTLQLHAQALRNQKEPNIDDLLHIVTESVAAYKVCQNRIDAVEKALEKALSHAQDGVGQPRSGSDGSGDDDDDDDEPF